jgi:hypothetical protein
MATNPKIPPRREMPDDHAHVVIAQKRNNWWPPVLIIVALAIIGALIWWLSGPPSRKSAPSTVSSQVNGANLQLTKLSATTPTTTGEFNVTGTLVNNGNAPITGVQVQAAFKNIHGQTLETIPSDVEPANAVKPPAGTPAGSGVAITKPGSNPSQTHGFVMPGGGEGNLTQATNHPNEPTGPGFANQPIPPGQSVPIAIPFTHAPSGWVGGVPILKITNVETAQQGQGGTR